MWASKFHLSLNRDPLIPSIGFDQQDHHINRQLYKIWRCQDEHYNQPIGRLNRVWVESSHLLLDITVFW